MNTIIGLLILLSSSSAYSAVWETHNNWTDRAESQFQHWVKTKWKYDIFSNPRSPYYGIATDCADATYSMRMIFAYENKLPFVITDPSNRKRTISNKKSTWDKYSSAQRLRKFTNYIHGIVSTKSLPDDSYPVAVTPRGFAAGAFYTTPGVHSYQVTSLDKYGILEYVSSTVPRAVRALDFYSGYPYYLPSDMSGFRDGYRRFRWPRDLGKHALNVPGANTEQFHLARKANYNYMPFTAVLLQRLGKVPEVPTDKVLRLNMDVCNLAVQRIQAVDDALEKVSAIGGRCMTRSEYDNYSTPTRDGRLKQSFIYLSQLMKRNDWHRVDPRIRQIVEILFANNNYNPDTVKGLCKFSYADNKRITMKEIWMAIKSGRLSSHPNDSVDHRWGKGSPYTATSCQIY